jgi:hypothetical protein
MTKLASDLWDRVAQAARALRQFKNDDSIPQICRDYWVCEYRRVKTAFNQETRDNLSLNW